MTFSARSPSERQLDRIHSDDDEPLTREDVIEKEMQIERDLAGLIAAHPSISMSTAEILECCEYDREQLQQTAEDMIPSYNPT